MSAAQETKVLDKLKELLPWPWPSNLNLGKAYLTLVVVCYSHTKNK